MKRVQRKGIILRSILLSLTGKLLERLAIRKKTLLRLWKEGFGNAWSSNFDDIHSPILPQKRSPFARKNISRMKSPLWRLRSRPGYLWQFMALVQVEQKKIQNRKPSWARIITLVSLLCNVTLCSVHAEYEKYSNAYQRKTSEETCLIVRESGFGAWHGTKSDMPCLHTNLCRESRREDAILPIFFKLFKHASCTCL